MLASCGKGVRDSYDHVNGNYHYNGYGTSYRNYNDDLEFNCKRVALQRHPGDVKNYTDEAGRNTERNYIIRAKCIESYIMALCL